MANSLMIYHPLFTNVEIGIGTWSWGDRMVWGYGNNYSEEDITQAFQQTLERGVTFFDTAEVYGQGKSETFLGKLIRTAHQPVKIATKFMPFPWRLGKKSLENALQGSLSRLGMEKVDLYQVHWPVPVFPVDHWMEQMAEVHQKGLIDAVGISNYDLGKTIMAVETLKKNGLTLASNQMEYHLLDRGIEKTGLLKYCIENGIKILAYSPLAMGMLSGKYTPENLPKGARANKYSRDFLSKIQPLICLLKKIGQDHDGKTASQVALNWVICKGALPIPGAKNARQAGENIGSLNWRLTQDEIQLLDELSEIVLLN